MQSDESHSDQLLVDRQRALVRALADWHGVAPGPKDRYSTLSEDQRQELRAAMDAEAAYDTRRGELGLL